MSVCIQNAGPALRGFLYQFLHTLLALMESAADADVATQGFATDSSSALFRVEGWQDLDKRTPQRLELCQLKDVKSLGPKVFAQEVLRPFAVQFESGKSANAEFQLITSAKLGGGFFPPFRALCTELRRARENGTTLDAALLSNSDAPNFEVRVPSAAAWASRADGTGRPVPRGLSPSTPSDFIKWLLGCTFIRNAGITDRPLLLNFLSRVLICDTKAHGDLASNVLQRLQERLPVREARRRLDAALGRLLKIGAAPQEWQSARSLLWDLGIPPGTLSWHALRKGTARAAADVSKGASSSEDRHEALLCLQTWSSQANRPLFVLGSRGMADEQTLLQQWLPLATEVAPALLVNAGCTDDDIIRRILEGMGWDTGDSGEWQLAGLLQHISRCADLPEGRPALVLAFHGVTGAHESHLCRMVDLAVQHGTLVLLSLRESWLRSFDSIVRQDWSKLLWVPHWPRGTQPNTGQLPVSYDLPPPQGLSIENVVRSIAEDCEVTVESIDAAMDAIMLCAFSDGEWTGRAPRSRLQEFGGWRWDSTSRKHLPRALVDHGLVRLDYQDGKPFLVLSTHPAIAELVAKRVDRMGEVAQADLSSRLASLPDTQGNEPLLDGFLAWLGERAPNMEATRMAGLLRPWLVDSPPRNWAAYVASTVGRHINGPIKLIVEELAKELRDDPTERRHQRHTARRLLRHLNADGPEAIAWLTEWLGEADDWLRYEIRRFMADAQIPASVAGTLRELAEAPEGSDSPDELSDAQRQLALTLVRYGPPAVPEILARLDPAKKDASALLLALAEIGSPEAAPSLEAMCASEPPGTKIGTAARRALALCGSHRTAEYAVDALNADDPAVAEVGFWMVAHGRCEWLHPEVARAAREHAKQGRLHGTDFLLAALAACASATRDSWSDLRQACESLLSGQHTVWMYRHMIQARLPEALVLLLDFLARMWGEHQHETNAILYTVWAMAEEPVRPEQLCAAEIWLKDEGHSLAVSEALLGLAAGDRMGFAWKVAVALKLRCAGDALRLALGREQKRYDVVKLLRTIPCPEAVPDIAPLAADQQHGALCVRGAEALAAQRTPAAFGHLVDAVRKWQTLYKSVGFRFAESAVALDMVQECANWLADTGEAKCLRQGAAIALGLALRKATGSSRRVLCEVLSASMEEGGDVSYAATMAAGLSGAPELLSSLAAVTSAGQSDASQAIHAIAAIGSPEAITYLYELWHDRDIYFMEGAPTTALALALERQFADATSRTGEQWEHANGWVGCAYERFRSARARKHPELTTGLAIASALLRLGTTWQVHAVTQAVLDEIIADDMGGWYASDDQHLRWKLLANTSPDRLLAIMLPRARGLSESNRLALIDAFLNVKRPDLQPSIGSHIIDMCVSLKSNARRRAATLIAGTAPEWLREVKVQDEETALLLRDVAANASPALSREIIDRLLAHDWGRVRRAGAHARWLREAAAPELLEALRKEEDPFRRLWWVNAFAGAATEAWIRQIEEMNSPRDLFRWFAINDAKERAKEHLRSEAGREDFRRRSSDQP